MIYLMPDGKKVLVLGPLILESLLRSSSGKPLDLHRTPVTDMQGDALDAVELEMVNDSVVEKAEKTVLDNLEKIEEQLKFLLGREHPLVLELDDLNSLSSFLMWSNSVYVKLRSEEDFTVGTPGDGGDLDSIDLNDDLAVAMMVTDLVSNCLFSASGGEGYLDFY